MEWFKDYSFWISAATLATAIFTGLSFLIAWQLYKQTQVSIGRQRPIIIRSPITGQPGFSSEEDRYCRPVNSYMSRVAHVFVYNQSDIRQTVTILDVKIKGRKFKKLYCFAPERVVELDAHTGGNLGIWFCNADWGNLSDDELTLLSDGWHAQKCLLYVRGHTLSGKKLRFSGVSTLLRSWEFP